MLVHRLLSGLPPDKLYVMTDRKLRVAVESADGRVLPGHYRYFFRKGLRGNRWRIGRILNGLVNLGLAAAAGFRTAWIARTVGAAWILTVADEGFSPIAGALASRLARRPHVVMVFDLWAENAYTEFELLVARALERPLFRSAAAVIVHCPEMAEHYRRKHGIHCDIVPTSFEATQVPEEETRDYADKTISEIAFAGAIYWAQEDAVRRLSRAVRRVRNAQLTLIGSWATDENLSRRMIEAGRVEPQLDPVELQRRLRRADALFVGLSFNSAHPDIIRTASPAKLPEYMALGRPLLIHAPHDSHVARYARAECFAEVIDIADEDALVAAIEDLIANPERAAERALRAQRLAKDRHDVEKVRQRFAALLESLPHR